MPRPSTGLVGLLSVMLPVAVIRNSEYSDESAAYAPVVFPLFNTPRFTTGAVTTPVNVGDARGAFRARSDVRLVTSDSAMVGEATRPRFDRAVTRFPVGLTTGVELKKASFWVVAVPILVPVVVPI